MVCPVCPVAGMFGGYMGGYFGINMPEKPAHRAMSACITAGLIVITVVALKCLFGISVCDGNGDFSLRNITQVSAITLVLGVIYSIAVNYLLNLWFSEPSPNENAQNEATKHCCCSN